MDTYIVEAKKIIYKKRKMKTTYFKLNIAIVLIFMLNTSCNKESIENSEPNNEAIQKIDNKYHLLNYSPNVYHDYFKQTENSVGFSSLKPNSLEVHNIVQKTIFTDKSSSEKLVFIDNNSIELVTNSKKIDLNRSPDFYGKTVRFKVVSSNSEERTDDDETEIEMYIPELVEIINPSVVNTDERFPLCDSDNFVLEWNADTNNEEGLVVVAEYFGSNAIPEDSQNVHIMNTDNIEIDDGYAVLNPELFKNIPNLSIVHIVLLRGNVAIEEIEGELYKFFAESHVRLPLILVKDINTVVKID